MRTCQTCGATNPAGTSTCYACLDTLAESVRPTREALTKSCTGCSARNPDHRSACYACGNPLPERERVVTCSACRAHNLASMKFCCGCAKSLAETVAAAARRAKAAGNVLGNGAAPDWRVGNSASWETAQRQLRAHAAADAPSSGVGARVWKALQGCCTRLQASSFGAAPAGVVGAGDRRR